MSVAPDTAQGAGYDAGHDAGQPAGQSVLTQEPQAAGAPAPTNEAPITPAATTTPAAAATLVAPLAQNDLPALLESLLFVSAQPALLSKLAQALEVDEADVEAALEELAVNHDANRRGLRVQRKRDRVQLITAPAAAPYVERYLGLDLSSKLSTAALEALAVVAYRQPLTRTEIEAVRGVNCDGVLRTLMARELVEPVGRLEQAGRPYLYGTTFQFLQYFGLESLDALPPLPEGQVTGKVLEQISEETK